MSREYGASLLSRIFFLWVVPFMRLVIAAPDGECMSVILLPSSRQATFGN